VKADEELFRDGDWSLHTVATGQGMKLYVWHRTCHNNPALGEEYIGKIDDVRAVSKRMPNYWCGWLVDDIDSECYRCGTSVPVNIQGLAIMHAHNLKQGRRT
jgi:hypothetical protein